MSLAFEPIAPAGQGMGADARNPGRTRRVGFSDPVYGEVMDFLIEEAQLLDSDRQEEWLDMLSPEIFYWMPVRASLLRRDGAGFDPNMAFMFETFASLKMRVARNANSPSAYAEDPVSRTRHLVSNLMLHATNDPDEFAADTNLLLIRNRGDEANLEQISARREDLVRRTADGWRLTQRIVLVDQAVLGTPNLAIFL